MDRIIQTNQKYKNTLKPIIGLFLVFGFIFFTDPSKSKAQSLSLSISPPLTEVVSMPQEENLLKFTLKNNGNDTIISPHIYPFSPSGEVGNVSIEKNLLEFDPSGFLSWFSFVKPEVKPGGKFILKSGDSLNIVLKLTPPKSANEGDYYFSLLFATESDSFLGNQGVSNQMELGTNILLTVSKDGNPKKAASIVEFSAPLFIDSFQGEIPYTVRLANNGLAFFKPEGTITVNPTFENQKTLFLAPQNIAVASTRQLYCLDNEALIPCQLKEKVLLGKYKAVLNFSIEGSDVTYSKEITTIAFPIYLTISIICAVVVLILIAKALKK